VARNTRILTHLGTLERHPDIKKIAHRSANKAAGVRQEGTASAHAARRLDEALVAGRKLPQMKKEKLTTTSQVGAAIKKAGAKREKKRKASTVQMRATIGAEQQRKAAVRQDTFKRARATRDAAK
jgi:O-phosphoseryl-tRNA(Cys) synthetase